MDFKDKVVLITGASSGIGAATAIYFAKHSAQLSLVARNEKNLRSIALYCEKSKGIKPLTIAADVTCDVDAERIISETIEHFSKIDVLINNAGIIAMGGILNTSMDDFDRVMSTNLRAVFKLSMVAVPHLIESKGCIINVSSVSSVKPNKMSLAYNLSKSALDHFTRCTALELAAKGVRVNSINPSFVKTNLLKKVGLTDEQLDLFIQNIVGNTPLKRPIDSEEVAGLIAFLAGDLAKNITGTCYVLDGGNSLV